MLTFLYSTQADPGIATEVTDQQERVEEVAS
jgi:hypothetical protein